MLATQTSNLYKIAVDTNQPYWQLAAIQVSAGGFPFLFLGQELTASYGLRGMILSTIVGSLILWVIGLAAVTTAHHQRLDAIGNFRTYFGWRATQIVAFATLILFGLWQALQLEGVAEFFTKRLEDLPAVNSSLVFQTTTVVGIGIVVLSLGSIKLIKWACTFCLPVLLIFVVWLVISNWPVAFQSDHLTQGWKVSLPATMQVVSLTFIGMVNLPTFFRHSRSIADSFLGLALLTIGTPLWIIAGAWLPSPGTSFGFLGLSQVGITTTLIVFSVLSLACANLVNIYFGAAGWGAFYKKDTLTFSHRWSKERLAATGLLGIGLFSALRLPPWTYTAENLLIGILGCLVVTLLGAVATQLISKHRPRKGGRIVNNIAWLIGGLAVVLVEFGVIPTKIGALASGVTTTAICLLVILFLEETSWSANKLLSGEGQRY